MPQHAEAVARSSYTERVVIEQTPPLDVKLKASGLIARAERTHIFPGVATMAEPASSAAGGGIVLWKAVGGIAIFAGIAAFFAAIVSMCMMTPRSPKEWAVGLISTVASSLGLGAFAALKVGLLTDMPTDPVRLYGTLVAISGLAFACGLPGWALVRAAFTWLEKREGKDLGELIDDAKAAVKS